MTSPQPTRTPNPSTTTRPEQSSRRVAHKTPLGWLPWVLLGLLGLLLAAALLLINAVDDDGPDGPAGDSLGQVDSGGSGLDGQDGDGKIAGTEDETGGGTDAEGGAQGGAAEDGGAEDGAAEDGAAQDGGAGAPTLTADGQDLLAASGGSLADRSGQAVTGSAVVESVVSDEGFWVGSSPESRVFVFLTPQARESAGESGFQVQAGQTVQVEGSLVSIDEAPDAAAGVEEAEGLSQLQSQGALVSADAVTLG